LLKAGLIRPDGIILSSLTGVSGAGRKENLTFHFPEMNEDAFAYGVGTHRHGPEINQILSQVAGRPVAALFQPHVGPFDRGILTSAYCEPTQEVTAEQVGKLYAETYAGEPFVRVLKAAPHVKAVARSNCCDVFPTVVGKRIVVFSAIDNLVKGASGQAIQNLNIVCGFDETTALL
jgi:N-acetyl-gamma-glutamyl-phosphate reductase